MPVARGPGRIAPELLGRNVVQRSGGHRAGPAANGRREAEVEQDGTVARRDHDVRWFDVAVHVTGGMKHADAFE